MSIVSIEDFTGLYNFPVNEFQSQSVQDIITNYEKEILVGVFGILLYNDFLADFVDNSGAPTQQRWIDFLDGKIYSPDGTTATIEYLGCLSFLVPMIYAEMNRNQLMIADTGFIDPQTEGSKNANGVQIKNKSDKAYNQGLMKRIEAYYFLSEYEDEYDDFDDYYKQLSCKSTFSLKSLRS